MRSTIESQIAQSGNAEEKKLFIKCVTITLLFFGSWVPLLCIILIQVVTSKPVSSAYDAFAFIVVALYSALNAICLIILDNRIKGGVRDMMAPFFQWNSSLIASMQMRSSKSEHILPLNEIHDDLKTKIITVSVFKKDPMADTVKIEK